MMKKNNLFCIINHLKYISNLKTDSLSMIELHNYIEELEKELNKQAQIHMLINQRKQAKKNRIIANKELFDN